uniref:Uncharacterized protein n=1 Tax=Ditylenchus dipsaci TaxID=166011 RepID=A0A915CXM8_9BILA
MSQKVEKTVEEQSEIDRAAHLSNEEAWWRANSRLCQKQVDYLAVTAHFVNDNWLGNWWIWSCYSLRFLHAQKDQRECASLVVEELEKLGIGSVNLKKLFITTDEGSNLAKLGGSNASNLHVSSRLNHCKAFDKAIQELLPF